MTNQTAKQETKALHIISVAKVCSLATQDIAKAVLGFIPNGLNLIYDFVFKALPLVGKFFAHRWVEQVIKLCSGITIGQGLAGDIAYYVFKPVGFGIGLVIGGLFKDTPVYQGQIGKIFYRLSAQTVGGALIALIGFFAVNSFIHFNIEMKFVTYLLVLGAGAILGLVAKGLTLFAIHSVTKANAMAARKNAQLAKDLNSKLKTAAKSKAKSMILRQAQDIVLQMNGPQSQANLEPFFEEEYAAFAEQIYQKLERHFNYLTDRACHGDIIALKRLKELTPKAKENDAAKPAFEVLVERMFNARANFKLKDDIDTAYDRWQYRFLSVKEAI